MKSGGPRPPEMRLSKKSGKGQKRNRCSSSRLETNVGGGCGSMMRHSSILAILAGATLLSAVVAGQQTVSTPSGRAKANPAASSAAPSKTAATVEELMATMIDPASKAVFNAVSSETTTTGTVEKAPKNDAEWAVVQRNAMRMVEGANLLLEPGRHIAPAEHAQKANEGELKPAEIEVRVAKDRAAWNKL